MGVLHAMLHYFFGPQNDSVRNAMDDHASAIRQFQDEIAATKREVNRSKGDTRNIKQAAESASRLVSRSWGHQQE